MQTLLFTIARFAPYSETGEFANVGIVGTVASSNYFGYKLLRTKHSRVTRFFSELDTSIYRNAMKNLEAELARMRRASNANANQLALDFGSRSIANLLLQEVLRKKEGVVRFSDVRMSICSDPNVEIERLYNHYVNKSFVTPQYVEQIMEREVRARLKSFDHYGLYSEVKLQDGPYLARFPFVRMTDGIARKVIKPISLSQERPEAIIEHANKWAFALKRLRNARMLPPVVLFPARPPRDQNSDRTGAYIEATEMLVAEGGRVVDSSDEAALKHYVLN